MLSLFWLFFLQISAFNNLTNVSLHLKVAEEILGYTHHRYSNSIRDPLCSLHSMLRMRPHSLTSVTCGRFKMVCRRSWTASYLCAVREVKKAVRILRAVHEHASNPANRHLYCGASVWRPCAFTCKSLWWCWVQPKAVYFITLWRANRISSESFMIM